MAIQLQHNFLPGYTADYWRIITAEANKTADSASGASQYGVSCTIGLYRSAEAAAAGEGALTMRRVTYQEPATITELGNDNIIRLCYERIMAGQCEDAEFWAGAIAV